LKKIISLALLFYCLLSVAYGQQSSYWQQQVNYKIDVTLNDADNTLEGYVKMDYINNSPDTLFFIWIHLWPNAYKNDRTAFSDQMLENGSTAFYFSDNDKRGYINRLNFRVNTVTAKTEDHPQHQDIIKLILPTPLAPKNSCKIETPFHVKLPNNFSRGGHIDQAYQITQWYPKPAVYDKKGWHPIPYLEQGEFYSEFGNYEVQITLPENYVVAATGELQNEKEQQWLLKRSDDKWGAQFRKLHSGRKKYTSPGGTYRSASGGMMSYGSITTYSKDTIFKYNPPSSLISKTIQFKQENVNDFAWFADKRFTVEKDTIKLTSGKAISFYAYYLPFNNRFWKNNLENTKGSITFLSNLLGPYPYGHITVADIDIADQSSTSYPTIATIGTVKKAEELEILIQNAIGKIWLSGNFALNEREYPWMNNGMNTYYRNRYTPNPFSNYSNYKVPFKSALIKKMPADMENTSYRYVISTKKDQPITTPPENFSKVNYKVIPFTKTSVWMKQLEMELGTKLFDSCMREYYHRWSFKHPYPEDFKNVLEEVSGKNLDSAFSLLNTKGAIVKPAGKKDIRFSFLFNAKETDQHHYIGVIPAIGYNFYDKWMLGIVLHNYTLPNPKLQFAVAPLYSSTSKKLNGVGRISYTWYPGNNGQKAELSLSGTSFTWDTYADSTSKLNYQHFSKLVPSFKFVFANKNPRSAITKFVQWKTFIINEQQILFTRDNIRQIDIITYPYKTRYINQLQFVLDNHRVLYPYKGALQIEQGDGFVRTNFTGNYYFNYAKGGGVNLRLFAGKFFYIGDKTFIKQFETDQYHLNMTGAKGYEDYTYSNYFIGRNEFDHYPSQQIMIRDGGFKVRTDLLSNKIGKTDDWLTAINLTSDIPKNINPLQLLPFKIPLKAFLDIGTYAEAWKKNAETGRFIYDAGLQLSLLKNTLNIYFPLLYSKVYSNYFKSTIPDQRFIKNIAFSIDIQNITLKKFIPQIPF